MPVDPNAPVRISAFSWVPPFAQGQVRDLRPRWALEEAGIAYAVRKLDASAERPADYYVEQPFGQVPSYRDDTVLLFESGAIVLHIGRDCETLLPDDPAARARATAWLIAALNSVEPYMMQLATIDVFAAGEEWAKLRRPGVIEMIEKRLSRLSDALGDKAYPRRRPLHGWRPYDDHSAADHRRQGTPRPVFEPRRLQGTVSGASGIPDRARRADRRFRKARTSITLNLNAIREK
jgi:glutathione S-transferase